MSRIDAPIATQIADSSRPIQTSQIIQHQADAARSQEFKSAEQDASSGYVDPESLKAASQQLKQVLEAASGKKFAFGLKIDDQTKDVVVEFRDEEGKVVKELPSREVRELQQRLSDLVGIFVDTKA